MATNYNDEGQFLGYFDTYDMLVSQYSGERGNLAIAAGRLYYHNGIKWNILLTPVDNTHLNEVEQLKSDMATVQETLTKIQNTAGGSFDIRWSLQQDKLPDEEPTLWSTSPMTPTADEPTCYVTMRFCDVTGAWSAWKNVTAWSHYQTPVKQPDKVQTIYRLAANKLGTTLMAFGSTLSKCYFNDSNYQNDDYVPTGWSETVPSMTSDLPYVLMSQRTKTDGSWEPYSTPVAVYSYNMNSAVRFWLGDSDIPYACNADGSRVTTASGRPYPPLTTDVYLYKGSERVDIATACTLTLPDDSNLTFDGTMLSYKPNTADAMVKAFTIKVEYEGETYTAVWRISKVMPGEDGKAAEVNELKFSASSFVKASDAEFANGSDSQSIDIYVNHIVGDTSELIDLREYWTLNKGENPDGYTIEVTTDTGAIVQNRYAAITAQIFDKGEQSKYSEYPIGRIVNGVTPCLGVMLYNITYVTVTLFKDGVYQDSQFIPVLLSDDWVGNIQKLVTEKVATSISNSEEFKEMREICEWVVSEDAEGALKEKDLMAYFYANFDLTATKITEEVSQEVYGELKKAGIEITADGVKIYGNKIAITDSNGNTDSNFNELFNNGGISLRGFHTVNEDNAPVMSFNDNGTITIYDRPGDLASSPYTVIDTTDLKKSPITKYNAKGTVIGRVNWANYNSTTDEATEELTLYRLYDSNGDIDSMWSLLSQAVARFVEELDQPDDYIVTRIANGNAYISGGDPYYKTLDGYYTTGYTKTTSGAPVVTMRVYEYKPISEGSAISEIVNVYIIQSAPVGQAGGNGYLYSEV